MQHSEHDDDSARDSYDTRAGGELTPAPGENGAYADDTGQDVGELVGRIVDDGGNNAKLLARLTRAMARSARAAGVKGVAGGRWLTDLFTDEIAPRIPVRDLGTLRQHHNGLDGEELADALARNAAAATTAVGAAGGALAAVQTVAPPLLLTAPAKVAAEAVVVAAIEVKLIGELHEVYGARPAGSGLERGSGYLMSWVTKRGLDRMQVGASLTAVLGAAAKAELRKRLMRVMGRHLSTLGPYLTGAAAGGALNRSATVALARSVRGDLRASALPVGR
ncbi:hypothetical protein F4561_003022 [Lipingzhangella halophila]|uniref:EcsC family protein n=1 Tax=Lipingzhangella halophila TaxID=1783352 RepID=A0A7W7W2Q7_9ACTN|nr:hypothetical protein [Lipingzhangella halophila]MBB4932202.1 hypothetical protein [Lipingzhangella halophila]